ncbi:spore germination protein [Halobacillus seohaensis]|uniref:Spore germination protein n=1 Tax=Halobacillus seohaensis TaxID=447421 RepID=A0ABW2EK44_9BACI
MWKWRKNKEQQQISPPKINDSDITLEELYTLLSKSRDFVVHENYGATNCTISYIKTVSDSKLLNQSILPVLKKNSFFSLEEIRSKLSIDNIDITTDPTVVREKMMQGDTCIQINGNNRNVLVIPTANLEGRKISIPEVEFSVVGPKEAFVESIDTNINLLRKRLKIPEFTLKEVIIGELTKTRVNVVYIEGIADQENINTVIQRLEEIDYDQMIDSSYISQMIADNSNSPFPQFLDTERPDRVVEVLAEGKISILVDGSPHALTCPTTIVEFFSASDDYFLPWHLASVFRLIRVLAVIFSVLSTAIYVAVLTHHHEMIPEELMSTIISSRADIPFPPILEVIVLELTIELLREAGARLPTKIGQTIGIVGGIVIGTAAVDAGLTSNVLLIIVALAALASFTTPVYQIGNTIRIIRFPFIIGAQVWGLVGITFCMLFFIGHLIKLESIGRPFFAPLYPFRFVDFKDAFIRFPFSKQVKRPLQTRPVHSTRLNYKDANEKRDIDE